ncbi:MAG: HAD family hydrolase [Deltaproteobacteria bacterium]|nr:HAD family hydrolase [Deltaproteobacteria bacterium]MBW2397577.1 HAD family hydrolase [Deltaproteobacteria bacterium]
MTIRAVVFDLFDTLVDLSLEGLPKVRLREKEFPSSLGVLHEIVAEFTDMSFEDFADTLFALDSELRKSRYEQGRELPTLERFERLLPWVPGAEKVPGLAARLTATHMDMLRGQVGFLDHHPEVLEALGDRKLAVCSNFSHSQTAFRVLEEARLRWHFDVVVVSDATGWRKPRPEIFQATLAALGVEPDETLHVGDSLKADVTGAAAAGLRTAWITRRIADPDQSLEAHEGPSPDLILHDLSELPSHLG